MEKVQRAMLFIHYIKINSQTQLLTLYRADSGNYVLELRRLSVENSLKLKMILEKSLSLTMSEVQGASYVSSARYAPGAARARHLTCAGVFVLQFMYICNVFFYFIKKINQVGGSFSQSRDEYQRSARYCAVKQFQSSIVIKKY